MKNTMQFLGIIVLATASFGMLACMDINPVDKNNGDNGGNNESFSLATLKTPNGVKSVYLSDIAVNDGVRAAAGSGPISSLSYITSTGQNAPILFSTPSGKKQFIFDVTGVEQLGERCIIINITGYYEVTGTGEAGSYTVGPKVNTQYDNQSVWDEKTNTIVQIPKITSVLIDMKNIKLYDFSEFESQNSPPWPVRFMEGNIIYTAKDTWTNNGTVYKIDLSTASVDSALQAVPLNNSAFMPINSISLPYTINNKLIGNKTINPYSYGNPSDNTISLDVSGTKPPQGYKSPEPNAIDIFNTNVLIRDLTGKPWVFTIDYSYIGENYISTYSTAVVSIDDSGQCILNNVNNGPLSFVIPAHYYGQIFTFNAAGTGSAIIDDSLNSKKMRSFLNNGVVTLYPNGFIRLRPEVDGIKVESTELTITSTPTSLAGKSVISPENYLFWLEDKAIKRQKLEAGSSPQVVYPNSGIMDIVTTRELLTASGRKLIFYQYAEGSATEVHTYSLDMYNPNAQPDLLATNDAEIRSIVELDF